MASSKKSQKAPSICSGKGKRVALKKIETNNNEGSEFIYPTTKKSSTTASKNYKGDLFSDTFTVRSRESH